LAYTWQNCLSKDDKEDVPICEALKGCIATSERAGTTYYGYHMMHKVNRRGLAPGGLLRAGT